MPATKLTTPAPAAGKKNTFTPAKKGVTTAKADKPKREIALPSGPSAPRGELMDYTWLIYGERKIGKTTLLAQFEENFFLMAEPGGRGLSILQTEVEDWAELLGYVALLEKNPQYCKMVTLDTGDAHYLNCLSETKRVLGLDDIRDKAWGQGWVEMRDRFRLAHERIYRLGMGFAVTAHSEVKTIKPKFGPEYDKLCVQMSGQAFKYYAGIVDTIAYYHYDDDGKRFLQIRGDETVEAGTRLEGRFLYKGTGEPIVKIPMGQSPQEGYNNLVRAFNNDLTKEVAPVAKKTTVAKKA